MNKLSLWKFIIFCAALTPLSNRVEAKSAPLCFNLFSVRINPHVETAILAGIKIFDQGESYPDKVKFAFSYFHGTSVESVSRSARSDIFLGSPVRDFEQLSERFDFYKDKMVVHAIQNKAGVFDKRDQHSISAYAQLAAKRFHLLRFLNDPSLYNSFFLFDLITFVENGIPINDLIANYKEEGFFTSRPELLLRLENTDLTFIGKKMVERNGVVLVIDSKVQADTIIERDVEHGGALALISEQGIPSEHVLAIIPQSRTERDELLKLVKHSP